MNPSAVAQHLRKDGRKGDTIVAHINPREAALLLRAGGSGSRNPKDGLVEFWNPSGGGGFEPGSSYSSDAQGGSAIGGAGSDAGLGAMAGSMGGTSMGLNMGAPPSSFGAAQPGLDAANPFQSAPSVPYNAPPPTAPVTMSPEARDMLIRTAYGEDGNNPAAIAAVVNNRYQDATSGQGFSQYGGSLIGQMSAPHQFDGSPTDPVHGAAAAALSPSSPTYSRIGAAVDGVMSGQTPDPTFGATSFYAPGSANPAVVAANPAFAGPSQTIGAQQFYGGVPSMVSLTAATHGDPFTKAVQAAISKAAMPSVNGMPGGLGYGDANSPAFATQPANSGPMRQAELGNQAFASSASDDSAPIGLRPLADNSPGMVPQPVVNTDAAGNALDPTTTGKPTSSYYNPSTGMVTPPSESTARLAYSAGPSSINPGGSNPYGNATGTLGLLGSAPISQQQAVPHSVAYDGSMAQSAPWAGGLGAAQAAFTPQATPAQATSWTGDLAGAQAAFGNAPANSAPPSAVSSDTAPPAAPITVPAPATATAAAPPVVANTRPPGSAAGDAAPASTSTIGNILSALNPLSRASALASLMKSAKPGTYSPTSKGGNPSPVQLALMLQQAPAAPAAPQFQLNPDGSIPISWPLSQVQAYYASLGAPNG